jgi:hypothetical protein
MSELKFQPKCLACSLNLGTVEAVSYLMKSGELTCKSCGEHHIFQILGGRMKLKRTSVPEGVVGPTELTIPALSDSSSQTSTRIQPARDECSEFAVLVRRRAKESGVYWRDDWGNPMIIGRDQAAERAIDKFRTNDDPLFRAGLYVEFLNMGLASQEEIFNGLDHALIFSLTKHTTKHRLGQFLREFDILRKELPLDEVHRRTFKFRKHIFQRPMPLRGFDADRLLPKMRSLLESKLWQG